MRRNATRLALAVGLVLASGATRADWKNDYDRGLRAIEAGNWADAEAAFRSALREEAQPSARKRFQGVVTKAYVPHYYAGLAAYRQGNCQRALEMWNNAASAAVVAGLADLEATQSRGMSDCRTRLAATAAPNAPSVAGTTPPTPPVASPPTTPAGTGTKPPATTPSRPVATTTPATTPGTRPATGPAQPPASTPTSTAPPPAALVAAVEGFLAGRYAAVVQLDPAQLPDGRSRAQAHLLRAAARYTLAQLADGDEAQLEQVRRDVRAARGSNATLTPDETLFSPRFRAFWRETR